MRRMKTVAVVLAAGLVLCCAVDAQATITSAWSKQSAVYPVSNSDLLQTSFGSVTALNIEAAGAEPIARNGTFDTGTGANDRVTAGAGRYIEYQLDVGSNPGGYDITGINTYGFWANAAAGGRSSQEYRVRVSFTDSPTTFVDLIPNTDWTSGILPTAGLKTEVTHVNNVGGVLDNGTISATGVQRVRFDFGNANPLSVNMYRELDVIGAPSAVFPAVPVVLNGQINFNSIVTNQNQTAFTSAPITLTDAASGESATIAITMTSLSGDQFLKLDGNTRLGVGNAGPDGFHVDIGNSNGDNNPLPEDVRFDVTLISTSSGVGSVGFNITDLGLRDTGNPSVSWTSSVSTTPVLHSSFSGETSRAMDSSSSFHALSSSDYSGTLAPTVNQFQFTDINTGNGIQFSVQLNAPALIPEPMTMLAVGLGITGLGGYIRKRRRG